MSRWRKPTARTRVEIPSYLDMWARGARFGTVVAVFDGRQPNNPLGKTGLTVFEVEMDHPDVKKTIRVIAKECKII